MVVLLELSLYPQGWGVSENLHNQIFLLSFHSHFSLYFHHDLFHHNLPLLSLSLSLHVSLAAAAADWVFVSIFLLIFFCFLTNIVYFCVINTGYIIWSGLHMDSFCPLSNPFRLELYQCHPNIFMKPNSWERLPPSLCLCNCM